MGKGKREWEGGGIDEKRGKDNEGKGENEKGGKLKRENKDI